MDELFCGLVICTLTPSKRNSLVKSPHFASLSFSLSLSFQKVCLWDLPDKPKHSTPFCLFGPSCCCLNSGAIFSVLCVCLYIVLLVGFIPNCMYLKVSDQWLWPWKWISKCFSCSSVSLKNPFPSEKHLEIFEKWFVVFESCHRALLTGKLWPWK